MRLFVAGDTHGNTPWVCDYLYPMAERLGCDGIIQLGDFGYWEHEPSGEEFLDAVSAAAERISIPWYFLRGNHDKLSLLLERYDNPDHRILGGFLQVRPGVFYIPDGHTFEWQGVRFRAFGGAYSVDKEYRLSLESRRNRHAALRENARQARGLPPEPVPNHSGTLWFPEEEMTDDQLLTYLLERVGRVDVVLSHDKPRSTSAPGLKDLLGCKPNQDRLQRVLHHHRPKLWLHGHLHTFYDQRVRSGDRSSTRVICLSCDDQAAGPGWRHNDTFLVLDWQHGTSLTVYPAAEARAAWHMPVEGSAA